MSDDTSAEESQDGCQKEFLNMMSPAAQEFLYAETVEMNSLYSLLDSVNFEIRYDNEDSNSNNACYTVEHILEEMTQARTTTIEQNFVSNQPSAEVLKSNTTNQETQQSPFKSDIVTNEPTGLASENINTNKVEESFKPKISSQKVEEPLSYFEEAAVLPQACLKSVDNLNPTMANQRVEQQPTVFNFKIQPQQTFYFHYPSDKHKICLKSSDEKLPCIYFESSNRELKELYLHMDLFDWRSRSGFYFSPYSIARNTKELTADGIFDKLQLATRSANSDIYEHELKNFFICHANETKRITNVQKKCKEFNKNFPTATPFSVVYDEANITGAVMLGCQVVAKINNHYYPLTERIYSVAMYPENLFSIKTVKPRFITNAAEIIIELKNNFKKLSLENVKIFLSCSVVQGKHGAWQEVCCPKTIDENERTISFSAPICRAAIESHNIESINCDLRLIRILNENEFVYCSKPNQTIVYEIAEKRATKREFPASIELELPHNGPSISKIAYQTDSCVRIFEAQCAGAKMSDTSSQNITDSLDRAIAHLRQLTIKGGTDVETKFLQLNEVYALQNAHENSIVHDAIVAGKFQNIYEIMKSKRKNNKLRERLPTLRNKYGETPLHYACKWTKGQRHVLALARIPHHALYMQNKSKQTPIHVAVTEKPACLAAFTHLILNEDYASDDLHDALNWALQIYDENGYTFLHSAVLMKRLEFVEVILKYCQNQGIDPLKYFTLENERTILDLAADQSEMLALIFKYETVKIEEFEIEENLKKLKL